MGKSVFIGQENEYLRNEISVKNDEEWYKYWIYYKLKRQSVEFEWWFKNRPFNYDEYGNYDVSFLVTIDDVNEPYTIQLGREYNSLTLDTVVSDIDGVVPSFMVATVEYLG